MQSLKRNKVVRIVAVIGFILAMLIGGGAPSDFIDKPTAVAGGH